MQSLPDLVIVGAGGHATSVADVAVAAGHRIRCFVDPIRAGCSIFGIDIVASLGVAGSARGLSCVIAIGDNSARACVSRDLLLTYPDLIFPVVIHPAASISPFAHLGDGTVVMAGAVIGPATVVGRFCIVNTLASVDHDCLLNDFASMAPGSHTGGRVSVGERSAICLGAHLREGVRVGNDCVVGANSYVHGDLHDGVLVTGSPAKIRRTRNPDEPYLARPRRFDVPG